MGLVNPKYDFDQINTLSFKLVTTTMGAFALESFGGLARTLSIATAPTNQVISTGKQINETPEFSILCGNNIDMWRMEAWYQMVKTGMIGYKNAAVLQCYGDTLLDQDNMKVKLSVVIDEIFPIEFGTPAFSTDGDGEVGMATGRFSVYGTSVFPIPD